MKTTKTMKSVDVTVWVLLLLVFASVAAAQTTVTTKAKTFPTTEEAVNALIEAADKFDETALLHILGPESYDITHTGEPARDREVAKKFADEARVKNHVTMQPKNARRAFLAIGEDDWPFPIPLVKGPGGWSFDSNAGRTEILYRRVGSNERALYPKIINLDRTIEPSHQNWCYEIHPEISFSAWNNGTAIRFEKNSEQGRQEREFLIDTAWPGARQAVLIQLQHQGHNRQHVGLDDINDAFAALWTARRITAGQAKRIPDVLSIDARGLRMEILY